MSKSIQQIKQDLTALQIHVDQICASLNHLYLQYLNLLSESAKKQLILASYQICTQNYPELFLELSFSQRQKLQQDIQKLAKQIKHQLISYFQEIEDLNIPQRELLQALINANIRDFSEESTEQLLLSESHSDSETEATSQDNLAIKNYKQLPEKSLIPEDLIKCYLTVEAAINEILENLSKEANRYLQKAKVLPNQLPPKILEMAIQAEEANSISNNMPNLLNVLIETDNNKKSDHSHLSKIIAIKLRLAEIEFADPILLEARKQIRNLLSKLEKVNDVYQKRKREWALAEAEAAWRSSWFETE